ncbi:hypothetical protein SNE40_001233 [Patella caerulea]|uniref:Uncharacterized protein n=1 Tax=Patella caerulea TaxID=87958 RepID=A0AAN8KMI1_PATCE
MSGLSEVGISPVLLQAISHTLTSSDSVSTDKRLTTMNVKQENPSPSKVVSHLLQGMNEPVASLLQSHSGNKLTIKSEVDDQQQPVQLNVNQTVEKSTDYTNNSGQDVSMVNVLTALATQHLRNNTNSDTTVQQQQVSEPAPTNLLEQHVTNEQGQHIIIYYNSESGAVPSPANEHEVVIENMESSGDGQGIRLVMQQGDEELPAASTSKSSSIYMLQEVQQAALSSESHTSKSSHSDGPEPIGNPCPICGDKISGYHYGIYTCESCKGFFKRTVQNKKTFVCHRNSDCEVNIYNRKKCPACRFVRCLEMGMRLAAIRRDRTRGGRSSYEGCLAPKSKPSPLERKIKRSLPGLKTPISDDMAVPVNITFPGDSSKSHLVAILNHSNPISQTHQETGPQTPELLTDIMNLEPLLTDEDIVQDLPLDAVETQDSLLSYLTQLTELRLYKLVRWARNLPQFGAISTDDQILLLQSCWSDLLALGVCWRTMSNPAELTISATKKISLEFAMGLGFGEVVTRLLSLSEHFQKLQMDQVEYVALKVLLLITPDVKGVKDPAKISEHQEKLMEALETYTCTHFPKPDNKFGELLLRLPELARISFMAKEILLTRLPKDTTTCGLLVELLKGENAAKDV